VQNDAQTAELAFELPLPPEYVPTSDLMLRVSEHYVSAAGTVLTHTLDAEVYELGDDGAAGEDLNATAEAELDDAAGDHAFEIDGEGLAPGARLLVLLRLAVAEAGDSGEIYGQIGSIRVGMSVRG
jgi:hypothetical protein